MRALIGPDLLRKLPRKHQDIRDTKITGFAIRCRPTGSHSYVMSLGRGRWKTIGTVADMKPEDARSSAQALQGSVDKKTLALISDDVMLTRREARAQVSRDIQASTSQRLTWGAFVTDHYEPWVTQNRKTGGETVRRLRAAFADFADVPLRELAAFTIERWRTARLKAGVKPATVNRDLAALRGALSKALEWRRGGLRTHPMTSVKAAKIDATGHVRFLDSDEESRLRTALTDRDERRRRERDHANEWRRERGYDALPTFGIYTDHLHPLVLLALHTGCRRGELFALRWADVDLVAARLTVRADGAKSGLARVIPLNTEAVTVLRTWRPTRVETSNLVFPGDDGNALVDVKTAWLRLMTDADIAGFRFHDCRHTFASKLVQAGVDLNTTRELLGHADLKMTLRYAHLAPEHKAAAVAKLVRA
ncbi:MAG: tyrosine-type recombinase/integrase [Vicinamibacterales bacterium]